MQGSKCLANYVLFMERVITKACAELAQEVTPPTKTSEEPESEDEFDLDFVRSFGDFLLHGGIRPEGSPVFPG